MSPEDFGEKLGDFWFCPSALLEVVACRLGSLTRGLGSAEPIGADGGPLALRLDGGWGPVGVRWGPLLSARVPFEVPGGLVPIPLRGLGLLQPPRFLLACC